MEISFYESSNHVSWPRQQRKVSASSFSYVLELLWEKNEFELKNVLQL